MREKKRQTTTKATTKINVMNNKVENIQDDKNKTNKIKIKVYNVLHIYISSIER